MNNDDKGFETKPTYGFYNVKKEDFDSYITFPNMSGPDLVAFWARHNYGAEVYQFKQWGPWQHISYGIIRRRDPSSGHIKLEEFVIVIDLDAVPPPTPVPWEVAQYAFEMHGRTPHLRLMPRAVAGELYMQEGLRPHDPPHTTVKIILASWQAGFVIVGHATMLLLLAQDRIPISEINRTTLPTMARQWENFRNLAGESVAVGADRRRKNQEPIRITPIIEIDATMLGDLIAEARSPANPIIDNFVSEAWILRQESAAHTGESTVPGRGDTFLWLPGWNENAALHLEWVAHPGRLQKCTKIGGHFFLNTKYAPVQDHPWPSWDDLDVPILPARPYRGKSVDLENVTPPYAVRAVPPVRRGLFEANYGGAVADVELMCEQALALKAELVAAWGPVLLFRGTPIEGVGVTTAKEPRALGVVEVPKGEVEVPKGEIEIPMGIIEGPKGVVEVPKGEVEVPKGVVDVPKGVVGSFAEEEGEEEGKEGEEEPEVPAERDLIIKVIDDTGSLIRGFDMGLQCLLDLFFLEGFPGRYFVCDPVERVFAEYDFAHIRDVAAEWATKDLKVLRGYVESTLHLRDVENLNVDLLVGDLFGSFRYSAAVGLIAGTNNLVGRWHFDEEEGLFIPSFTEEGLAAYKELVAGFMGQRGYRLHPIHEDYLAFKLEKENPEMYEQLAEAVKQKKEAAWAEGELDPDEPEPDEYDPKPWDTAHDDDAPHPDHPTWEAFDSTGRTKIYRDRGSGSEVYDSDEERHHRMLEYASGGDTEDEDLLPEMVYRELTEEEKKAAEPRPDEPRWDLDDDDPGWKEVFGDDEEAIRKAKERIRGKKQE